jgi:hypothetical protein
MQARDDSKLCQTSSIAALELFSKYGFFGVQL